MREVFISEAISKKDWQQTLPPDGWADTTENRIKADNGLGVYVADARQENNPNENDRKVTVILPPMGGRHVP